MVLQDFIFVSNALCVGKCSVQDQVCCKKDYVLQTENKPISFSKTKM